MYHTDHIPLTYVKNTSGKGPVSQFVLDNLSSLDYTITYRKGTKLVEADSVSRFPCLGPKELAPDGVKEAFDVLLSSLPNDWKCDGKIWINAQKETEIIQQLVRQWMTTLPKLESPRRVPYIETPTVERINTKDYVLALWSPPADKVKDIVNAAFKKGIPFACLVPNCLVHLLPSNPENKTKLNKSSKLVLLATELTWIIHGVPSIKHNVYSATTNIHTFGDLKDLRGIIRESPEYEKPRPK